MNIREKLFMGKEGLIRYGTVDKYINAACETARKHSITVCDCYSLWKDMYENGVDITALLSNHINHPTREMHELFAEELFKIIFKDCKHIISDSESTMYENK